MGTLEKIHFRGFSSILIDLMILIDVHMWHTNKWWGETYCTDFDMVISDLNVMRGSSQVRADH